MFEFDLDKGRTRLFPSGYTRQQIDAIELLVTEFERQGLRQKEQLAYVLATAYHECHDPRRPGARITPMEEFGGARYLKSKAYYPYYGRGFVQLTWRVNYQREGKRLGLDLMKHPEKALDPAIAANIAIHGMKTGSFTGKKLSNYINEKRTDYRNARRIINGTDKMELIASYALAFEACLSEYQIYSFG